MNNLINAKELFELKREANSKGLKFSAYRDTIEYSNELSNELLYMLCDVLCYHGFDVSSKKITDDLSFINMYIQAAVDRQLNIENPLIEDMDFCIEEMKNIMGEEQVAME
ncbi:hypothetical protein EB169_04135 [archaeon]|nr:hypothetical protein [archaeon]NDB55001.1 hypothetical protein [archaeon]